MSSSWHPGWRLLPSETVLWYGGPRPGVPRAPLWTWSAVLLFALAIVSACFSALIWISDLPAFKSGVVMTLYLLLCGVGLRLAPRYVIDPCRYMVTDRRVIWRHGALRRCVERRSITYARIRWHRSVPGVGTLELVCATAFGPLWRKQRVVLHDVTEPDRVLAIVRGRQPSPNAGHNDVSLIDRLEVDERVQWGASPEGWLLGWADVATASLGAGVLAVGSAYLLRVGGVLLLLERSGLRVQSWTWLLLFVAIAISCSAILSVGVWLLWHGLWGARALGRATEYILTDRRVLIRRGLTELSIDRRRIVDAAEVPCGGGLRNVFLILDSPNARALSVSGALAPLGPMRGTVPPVLYELSEPELVRALLFQERPGAVAVGR